ncbi:MAG: UvrD-helicase domain-containing protein [Thermoleophilia bacterium]|nr:UvrD-helicase domain-containing protein [Thermoleophilia bacterium]
MPASPAASIARVSVAAPENYLAGLNPAQREAVLTTEGPLLVIAGAGSGKTRVLTHRVAHLIAAVGAKPNEILAITFTNRAANEMRDRLFGLLGPTAEAIWILTFHAACGRILRREAPRLGYRSNFTIYDQADQVRLVKNILEEEGFDPKRFVPRGIHAQISAAKNDLVGPDDYRARVASFYDQTVVDVYDRYQRRLHASNAVDFDDLLFLTVQVLERFPEARERWQNAFRYVLVDEYQDTNHAQYRLLQLLAAKHRNVCAVGDPDQCLVAGTQITMADGTTKPIERVRPGDMVLSCYGTGDFRPAKVTRTHRSRRKKGVSITTVSGRRIVSTPEHVHFAGFKAGRTPQLHMTYLMWKAGVGFRVGVSRTYTNGQRQPPGLALRLNAEHADAAWVLSVHPTDAAARTEELLVSLRYGLPTIPFVARPRKVGDSRVVGDQTAIDEVFAALETGPQGLALLADAGLSLEFPHFSGATTTHGKRMRRRVSVTLCGDPRGGKPLHRIALFGYDDEGRRILETMGVSLRPAYKGSPGWRFETAHSDMARVIAIAEELAAAVGGSIRYTARLAARNGLKGKERNALPFMSASSIRPGMLMFTGEGDFDVVERVEHVALTRPVYDLDVERTHNFIANGVITHNSIYAFRGADIRNILEFERDFGETKTVALEQNYRSTNAILTAANAVIAHNSERKPKDLWSELGEGDPVRVVEVEDEHAEARFVAAEIASLVEQGYSGEEVAVFYRTNAQSRVLEDVLVRQGIGYRVIGGPRFYERAEIKDAMAYLQMIDNPYDALSLARIANKPRRGIGDTTLARLATFADAGGSSLWEAMERPEEAGVTGAPLRALEGFRTLLESLMAGALDMRVDELLERVLERTDYFDFLRAAHTKVEADVKIENLEELVGVAREYHQRADQPSLSGFLQEISLYSEQDALAERQNLVTLMTLHNAKGLEFRAVYVIGLEEGVFPHARSVEEQGIEEVRRLCYVGMTRAMERLTLTHASARTLWGRRDFNLPSRFLDELPADGAVVRERLRPTSWSGYGAPRMAEVRPRNDVPSLTTGDSVRHKSLGEGVVTGVEPGGVVTVRFAEDGSERKLVLEYAPLERI